LHSFDSSGINDRLLINHANSNFLSLTTEKKRYLAKVIFLLIGALEKEVLPIGYETVD
jgi:hypothetical protein